MLRPYNEEDLKAEIRERISEYRTVGQPVTPRWLTHAICKSHKAGLAVDADQQDIEEPIDVAFHRFNSYTHVRKLTTLCINESEDGINMPGTPFLPGFRYLQHFYVTMRDGEFVEVPTAQMTADELYAKADQYDRNAEALTEHANELRRYAAMREHEEAV